MNFNDLFRSLIGFPSRNDPPSNSPDVSREGQKEGSDNFWDIPPPTERSPFGFNYPSSDMFQHFDEMFRSFDELFKSMGMAEFPHEHIEVPGIEAGQQEGSLRDKMLKEPSPKISPHSPNFGYMRSQEKIDTELDENVALGDLDKLFPQQRQELLPGQPRSIFKSYSTTIVRKPDGSVEETRRVQDGSGNVETTVTRRHGNEEHTVITKEDGREERRDGQRDGNPFDWLRKTPRYSPNLYEDRSNKNENSIATQDEQTCSIYQKLFGKEFPRFWDRR